VPLGTVPDSYGRDMATAGATAKARIPRADAIAGVAKCLVGVKAFSDRINLAASRARPSQVKRQVIRKPIIRRPIGWALKLRSRAAAALRDRRSRRCQILGPGGLTPTTKILAQIQHVYAPTPGYQPEPVASEIEAARTLAAPRAPSAYGSVAVA